MPDDFYSSAVRHWDNSAFLASHLRWQEAAYLAGYVAECALKELIEQSNMAPLPFRHDLARLLDDGIELALLLSPLLRRYPLVNPRGALPGLRRWSETHRYEATGFMAESDFAQIVTDAHNVARSILVGLVLDGKELEMPV